MHVPCIAFLLLRPSQGRSKNSQPHKSSFAFLVMPVFFIPPTRGKFVAQIKVMFREEETYLWFFCTFPVSITMLLIRIDFVCKATPIYSFQIFINKQFSTKKLNVELMKKHKKTIRGYVAVR